MDASLQDESGTTDNRISWNPAEFPETSGWEDGKTYTITATVQQTATGEGKIISLKGEDADTGQGNTEGESGSPGGGQEQAAAPGDAGTPMPGAMAYPNPAVQKMMSR